MFCSVAQEAVNRPETSSSPVLDWPGVEWPGSCETIKHFACLLFWYP
jgi:hypothetical protein